MIGREILQNVAIKTGTGRCSTWRLRCCGGRIIRIAMAWSHSSTCCCGCAHENCVGKKRLLWADEEALSQKASRLRIWELGSFKDIADAKEGHMVVNGLERIMDEFPAAFEVVKPLYLKTRSLLFAYNWWASESNVFKYCFISSILLRTRTATIWSAGRPLP